MNGFDLWLTRLPPAEAIEPMQRHLEDARDQLSDDGGDMPTDDQVYALACMLAVDDAIHAAYISRQDEGESMADDRDEIGDWP